MSDWDDRVRALLTGALIVLVGLKLAGVIGWSWWWVTSPFWGAAAVGAAWVLGLGVDMAFGAAWTSLRGRRR